MEKKVSTAFGRKTYLLGKDKEGIWYWGFGYVRSYTNNEHPNMSRDCESHQHFDNLFLSGPEMCKDMFDNFFAETPLRESEKWKLLEIMKTIYTMKEYSEVVYRGGSHITTNPVCEIIRNEDEYKRINEIVLPKLFEEVYKLLGGDE